MRKVGGTLYQMTRCRTPWRP